MKVYKLKEARFGKQGKVASPNPGRILKDETNVVPRGLLYLGIKYLRISTISQVNGMAGRKGRGGRAGGPWAEKMYFFTSFLQ